jgi:hypothetical protein
MKLNNKLKIKWDEVVMVYFKVMPRQRFEAGT